MIVTTTTTTIIIIIIIKYILPIVVFSCNHLFSDVKWSVFYLAVCIVSHFRWSMLSGYFSFEVLPSAVSIISHFMWFIYLDSLAFKCYLDDVTLSKLNSFVDITSLHRFVL